MKISVGSDHAGFDFKARVIDILRQMGHEVVDFGADSKEACDYPDYGLKVAHSVADGAVDTGINVCWTGNGMMMASNKVKGVRAGLALNPDMAVLTRSHNDANLLVLASKYTPLVEIEPILTAFLSTPFEGGRHKRRVEKIMAEEDR
jgi:ribose 5-phosphate isomerase B